MNRKRKISGKTPPRPRFPEEERLPWLTVLLEMHAVTDAGVAAAVRDAVTRRGVRLACREGCTVCCRTQGDIAVFPLELTGISWYCTERLGDPVRAAVSARLTAQSGAAPARF